MNTGDSQLCAQPSRAGGPCHGLLPRLISAIALSVFFVIVYSGCNELTARRADVGHFIFPWERYIPLVPWMIVPYMSIDLFFFCAPLLIPDTRQLRIHAARIVVAITVAGICFLLFPLTLGSERPQVTGVFGPIFKFLHGFDRPYNLAPSLHLALRCIIWPVYVRRTRGPLRWIVRIWFVLIGASTLLIWQHHVLDWVSGQALGILCLYLISNQPGDTSASRAIFPRIAAKYALAAGALAAIACLTLPYGMLLVWPAFSLAAVAMAYLGRGPRVFRKRDGCITPAARWALGPFLIVERVLRLPYMRGPAYVEVLPGLWIGRRLNRGEAMQLLDESRAAAVLDLTPEATETRPLRSKSYRNIPILDFTAPTIDQLREAIAWIEQQIASGVYVHCALGYTRTGTIAASYLIRKGIAATPEEALELIRAARPGVVLNDACDRVLRDFASRQSPAPPLAV